MQPESYRPCVRQDVSLTEVEDGAVLFDSASERLHSLNTTAAYLWILADGSRTAEEIAAEISELTGQPHHKVFDDVKESLRTLRRENLLLADDVSP